MRNYIFIYLAILLFISLTSCSKKQYQNLFQQEVQAGGAAGNVQPSLQDYRIRPQDILQIRNLQNIKYIVDVTPSDKTATVGGGGNAGSGETFQVENDSTVTLPVIGHVKVGGLTRPEAARQIEDLYRKHLLKDPIIEVKIINLKVTVLGEIMQQGNYALTKDRTTLVEMIGQAGGLTEKANETNVKIIRGDQLNPEVTIINLSDIRSVNDPRTVLQNGDIIYIAQNKRAIRNEKLQNLSGITQPVLLLLNTALVIFTLSHR
ncbi:polysaccharide export outer membrane protein [Mucilaginibacter oryzae]|uniref:Polysaccharide export outer membrane protein n=1 Tax=Mucilaginibacter oryzae TaxID=468058 RepID=A0A316HC86_9SPHI|nr:polysaccharide biosynthesis/export family protein [Mucilaginibacter oryzae]PWK68297.1 polysaccharide export outer membrane protein [Mucilaginibacter oryzae]